MYKFFRIISNLAGIIGCIVAIFLLCNEYPSNDVKFDYIGFIIGILALLVTILVTWNIYSAIGIEQKVGKALSDIAEEIKKQIERNDKIRTEIAASIEDVKVQHTLVLERVESAEQAYEALFNATQAQVSALNEDNGNDFFQQYAHCQTALCAMLKCRHFPSDIRHNIKVLLSMMDGILKNREVSNSANDRLYDEDRKEFIQNMDDISKSSREEFSFEDRQKFMQVTAKAMQSISIRGIGWKKVIRTGTPVTIFAYKHQEDIYTFGIYSDDYAGIVDFKIYPFDIEEKQLKKTA